MPTPATDPEPRRSRRLFAAVIVLAAVSSLAVTALLINIFERKQEAKNPFYRVVELNDTIDDPATWAKNFPCSMTSTREPSICSAPSTAEAKRCRIRRPRPIRDPW